MKKTNAGLGLLQSKGEEDMPPAATLGREGSMSQGKGDERMGLKGSSSTVSTGSELLE